MTFEDIKRRARKNRVVTFGAYMLKCRLWMPLRVESEYRRIEKKLAAKAEQDEPSLSHRSGCCVIVGNGPSVRFEDLDRLMESGIDSFGANRITEIFPKTTWRPTYMSVMDPGFLLGSDKLIEPSDYLASLDDPRIKRLFLTDRLQGLFAGTGIDEKVEFVHVPPAGLFSTRLLPFSEDPSLYVSDLGSVTCFSIQLACSLGYERIYLYGIDHHYTRYLGTDGRIHVDNERDSYVEGIRHAESEKRLERPPRTKYGAYHAKGFSDVRKMDIGYRVCKEYADGHGVSIVNLTRGGELEVFPRDDFDKVIRKEESDER